MPVAVRPRVPCAPSARPDPAVNRAPLVTPDRRHRLSARTWIVMVAVSALWGSSFMFIKVALEDVTPSFIVLSRVALGALVLVPIALSRRALPVGRRAFAILMLVGLVQIDVPFLLVAVGEQDVTSSLAGILLASGPIFTVLLAAMFVPSERLAGRALIGVVAGLCGVCVLLGGDVGGDDDALRGGSIVLVACLGYAAGPLIVRRRLPELAPLTVATGIIGLGALACLPLLPVAWPEQTPDLETIGSLLALGVGGTGAAFLLYFVLVAEIGASRASVVGYIVPAFSVLYGVSLLSEPFTAAVGSGLALILFGSWLAARAPAARMSPNGSQAVAR
jgi:drug/metabolite transporter (DMT)-like permease